MIGNSGFASLIFLAASHASGQSIDYVTGTTEITGLSADGRAASGLLNSGAIYWSRDSGVYRISSEFSGASAAYAVSGDGLTVAGIKAHIGDFEAFKWQGPGTGQGIGHTPNTTAATGTGLNWDGSVMSVTASVRSDYFVACRWTQDTGMQVIGPLEGDYWSESKGISRDGSTIVGSSSGQFSNAFVWTATGGIRRLQRFGGVDGSTRAMGTNHDGSLIVGQSGLAQMVIWRNGVGELLSPASDGEFAAIGRAINDDGSVVVGTLLRIRDQAAAIWTPGRGFEELAAYLNFHGVTFDPSWTLADCTSVSADGKTFGGYVINSSRQRIGFVATIPAPASGIVLLGVMLCNSVRRRVHSENRSL